MGKNKNGVFGKQSEPGSGRKSYQQAKRMPPFGRVREFEEDGSYMELCWEAEQDARFLLGISNERTGFTMRAEPVKPTNQRVRSPVGSPLRKSYLQNREIKTESIYSQIRNDRTSYLDNRASFLAYRPHLSSKPSKNDKKMPSAILSSKTPATRKKKTPVSRAKSDSGAYSYSQDYSTGNISRDDDIDHLEDLRLSLLSWTTTTHESFVGSTDIQKGETPKKTVQRSISDVSMKRNRRPSPRGTPERRSEGKSPSIPYSGRSSRFDDWEGTDEEVARITAGASRTSSPGYYSSQRSRSAQDDRDSLFSHSTADSYYEADRLAHIRRMNNDGRTFLSRAVRMAPRKYNFMAQSLMDNRGQVHQRV